MSDENLPATTAGDHTPVGVDEPLANPGLEPHQWRPTDVDPKAEKRAEMRDSVPTTAGGPNVSYSSPVTTVVDNTPPQQLQDIAPAVGSHDYSAELSDTNMTEASFVQHDTGSGALQTTLEYNTATDGTASGDWQPADAAPAIGDGESSTLWDTSEVADGLHLVRATTMDQAGNQTQTQFQVVATATRRPCQPAGCFEVASREPA